LKSNDESTLSFVEGLKRQWMAMIDALIDPLMIVKEDYSIVKANRALAEKTGENSIKGVLKQKCYEVFANRNEPCEGCQMKKAALTKKVAHGSLEHVGDGRYFETTSQPVFDENGKLEGIVQVYRDRTEARTLQNQLLQNEKLASIGQLAGGIAHEINNPLGGILIFSQMLLREMNKSSPHYQDVVEIENATQRCKEIVESLLDFARQRPEKARKFSDLDLVEVLEKSIKFAKVTPQYRNTEIHTDWPASKIVVRADGNKLIQVFLNLLQNAMQAMGKRGDIQIRIIDKDEGDLSFYIVEISDNGPGMDEKTVDRIFDPFFTTKEPGEGTGLGLAICYGIMAEIKGKITVKSVVGKGSVFSVWFQKGEVVQ